MCPVDDDRILQNLLLFSQAVQGRVAGLVFVAALDDGIMLFQI